MAPSFKDAQAEPETVDHLTGLDASKNESSDRKSSARVIDLQKGNTFNADDADEACVVSDPIANMRHRQLIRQIVSINNAEIDTRLSEEAKPQHGDTSMDATQAPDGPFTEVSQSVAPAEQPLPAHHVEIPILPQLQIVRMVAVEVGEADSQVLIRLEERGGDVTMQLDAATASLAENLEASADALYEALRREDVQVSRIQFSKKSPIVRVQRTKEAN
jgi:hypothetical protein